MIKDTSLVKFSLWLICKSSLEEIVTILSEKFDLEFSVEESDSSIDTDTYKVFFDGKRISISYMKQENGFNYYRLTGSYRSYSPNAEDQSEEAAEFFSQILPCEVMSIEKYRLSKY